MMRKSPFVFDRIIIIQIKNDLGKCANCLQIGHGKFEVWKYEDLREILDFLDSIKYNKDRK